MCILFTFLVIFFSYFLLAQNITVLDEITSQPISNAYISINSKTFATDENGKVDLSLKKAEKIIISARGYETIFVDSLLNPDSETVIKLKPNLFDIETVMVIANKWEEKNDEVPLTVSQISVSNLDFINPQTSADLLGSNSHVFIQKSQLGGGSPMIRGFAANKLLIVVDGIRMNNAIYRSGNLQNVISIDPNSLEQAEIVFGPGSVLYGSDALGGVMDFHTKKPIFSNTNKLISKSSGILRYSTADNEQTGNFDLNIAGKKIASFTAISYSKFGDLKMGSFGPDEYLRNQYVTVTENGDIQEYSSNPRIQRFSGYSEYNLLQKFSFNLNNWFLEYGFYFSNTSDIPRYDRLIQYSGTDLKYAEWYYGPQKWMMNRILLENTASNKLYDNLKINIAYQDYTESRNKRKFNSTSLKEQDENVDIFSLNINATKNLAQKTKLFYGIEGNYNLVHSTAQKIDITNNSTTPAASRYPDGAIYQNYDAYLMLKQKIGNNIFINAGMRYSKVFVDATFDTTFYAFPFTTITQSPGALTGTIGAVYNSSNDWNMALNLSSGFRAPNIDDLGKVFDSEPGNVIVPNPDLQSEYLYNLDLRIKKEAKNYFFTVVGFASYLDNAMVRDDFTFNGQDSIIYDGTMSKVQALVNTSYAYIYGVEADAGIEFFNHIIVKGSYNYIEGKDKEGNSIRHAAPMSAIGHITYINNKIKADFYSIYNKEIPFEKLTPSEKDKPHIYAIDANGNPYCPSWWTLNFKIQYRFSTFLNINAGVENILDKRYRPYSSGIVAPGRNFIISLKFNI